MKILCAIDFSELTPWVVEAAAALAEGREGATITLVHVSPFAVEVESGDVAQDQLQELFEARMIKEKRRLERHSRDLAERGIGCEPMLIAGPVVETLLELARKERPNMIVLGARTKSTVRDSVLGSVSRHMLKGSRVPVVVVPPRMVI